jgi:hypothetical protein
LIYDVVIVDEVEVKDHLVFDYRPPEVLKIGTFFFFVNDVLQVSLGVSLCRFAEKLLRDQTFRLAHLHVHVSVWSLV